MKIHSVLISNYKGLNLSISLSDGINVITGENGSGKTNILQAIKFALGEDIGFSPDYITKSRNVAIVKVTLANKSLLLDKYSVLKKVYRSGEVKTYYNDTLPDNKIDCLLLDYDSHCFMDFVKLQEFVQSLKEKAKDTQIIIVTQSEAVINVADNVYKTHKVGEVCTLTERMAVA